VGTRASLRFARSAAALALVAGLATCGGLVLLRGAGLAWCVAGGSWMAAGHGRAGATFVLALGVCILARLVALTVGVLLVMRRDPEAFWPFVVGFAAGYGPIQVFESIWFARSGRRVGAETPADASRTR